MNGASAATVRAVEPSPDAAVLVKPAALDPESREWLDGLQAAEPTTRDEAV